MSSDMGSSNFRESPLAPSRILIVCDATKDRSYHEFRRTIHNIRMRGGIIHPGDTIVVFGVLHKVLHPMGYQMGVAPENFLGATHFRAMQEEVSKKVDMYLGLLQYSAEECDGEEVIYKLFMDTSDDIILVANNTPEITKVGVEVKITAGTPVRKVVIQEVATSYASWVIFDRHLRREFKYYLKHIPCKVALVQDNFSLEIVRHEHFKMETMNHFDDEFYCLTKTVPLPQVSDNENNEQSDVTMNHYGSVFSMENSDAAMSSLISSFRSSFKEHNTVSQDEIDPDPRQDESGNARRNAKYRVSPLVCQKQRRKSSKNKYSDVPDLCIGCGLKTELNSIRYSYPDIKLATDDFLPDNLLGEGGYGLVYKGKLKDGQLIAAKVRKEESTQGFAEFHSEIYVLSFARHKNIVMLLGYCCKENLNILVYEYICNKSLEWHLFNNPDHVLEWHRRYAIAIGTAKGLRFLHEECRGSPIIHRDMRPSNILLTHDFVPMLGDFGLAKWTTTVQDDVQTRILGTLGYVAPEYAENGIVSVRTDVYSFGIVLIQLISGRKAVDSKREGQQSSIRQWAVSLIGDLALHELVDPRLGESYNTYELYNMAKAAYLCVQTEPENRPSMAEVLRLLEGENDHFNHLTEQFIPHYK